MVSTLGLAVRWTYLIVLALLATMASGGGLPLLAPVSALGAPPEGFPLQSSQASPVTGAVTISAPDVQPEPGLIGVQFKMDGYVLEALDTTSPFQIVWSAASATDGDHTITAEARYSSGDIIPSAPLTLTVANPATFNRTLYVDAVNGNDGYDGLGPSTAWRTLAKANANVQAADTVYLRGTFSGQQLAPAVSGTAAKPITFTSLAGQTAVLSGGSTAVMLNGKSYVIFDGISIQSPSYEAFNWNAANHNVVRNCTMTNIGTAYGSWGHAFELVQSSDNLIEGNQITNVGNRDSNSGDSIWLRSGSNRNRFLNNTIKDGGHSLFQVSSQQSNAPVIDNVIAKNTLSNTYTTPIILAGDTNGSERTLIEYNKISDAGVGSTAGVYGPRPGIQIQAVDNIIRYNEIFNNAGPGISLNAYIFSWSGGNLLQESIGNQIYHNVFYGNNRLDQTNWALGTIAISSKNGLEVRDNLIANNIFYGNRGGISGGIYYTITVDQYHNNCDVWPPGSFNGNRIENNILLRQGGTPGEIMALMVRSACGGGNQSYTLSGLQNTFSSTVKNNLEVNPLFVNESIKDFHLQSGSPAIDRGLVLPGVAYLGAAPDLGAYEFNPAPGTRSPYKGAPFAVPGQFEAEDFDNGGEGVAYHDMIAGNAGGLYRPDEDVDIIANGAGYAVNNIETGEWLSYSINVAQAGTYRIEAAVSSEFTTSRWHIEIDNVDTTGSILVPHTGNWRTFQYIGKSGVSLTAGPHILKLYAEQQYFNLDALRLVAEDVTPPVISGVAASNVSSSGATITWTTDEAADSQVEYGPTTAYGSATTLNTSLVTAHSQALSGLAASTLYHYRVKSRDAAGNLAVSADFTFTTLGAQSPYRGVPFAVPGTIQAEDFDNGGEGVAYHDMIPGNAGGLYRPNEDVDIITSRDSAGGNYVVNNFETGEWLEYTIHVTQTGSYRMEVRAASAFSNSAYHLEVDGVDVTGPIVHPNTGSWGVFQNAGKGGIWLTVGTHVLRLVSNQQYADINSITITSELVAAYSFDEGSGTSLLDRSGNGRHGTLVGGPTWIAQGRYAGALAFSGNRYVSIPDNAAMNVTTSFSLTLWVKRASLSNGAWQAICQNGHGTGSWGLYFSRTDNLTFSEFGVNDLAIAATVTDTANWHHIALVKNGDTGANVTIYLDGVARGSVSAGTTAASGPKRIAGDSWYNAEFLNGSIDNMRLYNRALTPAEIRNDMNTPVGP